jgi:hypothetical protein
MNNHLDPELLKIPAYMRKKAIVSQARQKLILTALDRKEAHLPHLSTTPLATIKKAQERSASVKSSISKTPSVQSSMMRPMFDAPVYSSAPKMKEKPSVSSTKSFMRIGQITHFLDKISVAIIMLNAPIAENEQILVESEKSLFVQVVKEMQIDKKPVKKAGKGDHIGLKVRMPATAGGGIYRFNLT